MLGIKGPRKNNGIKGIEELFSTRNNNNNNNKESINITNAITTMKHDFTFLYRLIEDKLPCLCADFQIFLTRSGHLIHFDVERCFSRMKELNKKRCVPKVQELEKLVIEQLQNLDHKSHK